ncbi:hypothetical protein CVT24_009197 [Panaeolus cyanescens]|uniref:Uncharacterized protein n=1 Tax=Panaeolus cyanescens TaxID=181874 RepID=A0A409Y8M7_9AGAR|nr:hypothetical protein CVT24_009197 [Panaeolus cyanescens]
MCNEEFLFRPSFETDESSTSRLEEISSGPIRWRNLFSRSGFRTPRLNPVMNRSFSIAEVFEGSVQFLFLVPGGRFLLAHDNNVLAVFDLDSSDDIKPVISTKLDGNPVSAFVHLARDEEKLHVALLLMFANVDGATLARYFSEIYEISLSPQTEYTIRKIAGFDFMEDAPHDDELFASLSYDTMAILCSGIMRIWNFITDQWMVFRLHCDEVDEMIFLQEDILFVHESSISIYSARMQDVVPRAEAIPCDTGDFKPSKLQDVRPRSERQLAISGNEVGQAIEGLEPWFVGGQPSTYFERHIITDVAQDGDGEHLTVDTYFLEDADPNSTMSIMDPPLEQILTFKFRNVIPQFPSRFRPCNGALYRLVRDRYALFSCFSIGLGGDTPDANIQVEMTAKEILA